MDKKFNAKEKNISDVSIDYSDLRKMGFERFFYIFF